MLLNVVSNTQLLNQVWEKYILGAQVTKDNLVMIILTQSYLQEHWILIKRIQKKFIRLLQDTLTVWLWWKLTKRYIGLAHVVTFKINPSQFNLILQNIYLIFLVLKDLFLVVELATAKTLECKLVVRLKISIL